MSQFLSHYFPSHRFVFPSSSPAMLYSFKPISSSSIRRKPISATIPARDKIIDFGKYRGKMLGTLPSKYLKWVSKTLRARDFEEWAKLADVVLQDPVYKDRLEWELAEQILNGDFSSSSSSAAGTVSPVSDLLEISNRFGWDNDNKIAWSKIDFSLLGTSKSGRIPRISVSDNGDEEKNLRFNRERKRGLINRDSTVSRSEKIPSLEQRKGLRISVAAEDEGFEGEKDSRLAREERRERLKVKRGRQMHKLRLQIGAKKLEGEDNSSDNKSRFQHNKNHDQDQDRTVENCNPFPGRAALLMKVLNNNRRRNL